MLTYFLEFDGHLRVVAHIDGNLDFSASPAGQLVATLTLDDGSVVNAVGHTDVLGCVFLLDTVRILVPSSQSCVETELELICRNVEFSVIDLAAYSIVVLEEFPGFVVGLIIFGRTSPTLRCTYEVDVARQTQSEVALNLLHSHNI